MNAADQKTPNSRDVVRDTRIRTFIRRRRRFWRTVAMFVFAVTVMVLLTLANRDSQRMRSVREQSELVVEALQETAAERGELPLRLPEIAGANADLHQNYYFNIYYVGQAKWMNPVGVCCQDKVVRFYVRGDGRPVVLYDGEKYYAEWMTETQFRAKAESLGLGALLTN